MSLSAWFWSDIINVTVRDNLYFWTNFSSVQSHLQISILLPTLVCSDAFLVSVIDTHQCTYAKSMNRCNSIVLHCSAKLIVFRIVSNCHMDMLVSIIGHSQHAAMIMFLLVSNETSVMRELASTHALYICLFMHHLPISPVMFLRGTSFTSLFQPDVIYTVLQIKWLHGTNHTQETVPLTFYAMRSVVSWPQKLQQCHFYTSN